MKAKMLAHSLILGALVWPCAQAANAADDLTLVPPNQMQNDVTVHVREAAGGKISGIVTNNTGHRIKDPELLIRYDWIWENERQPGEDNPGWAASYVVPQEIGANESVSSPTILADPCRSATTGTFSSRSP